MLNNQEAAGNLRTASDVSTPPTVEPAAPSAQTENTQPTIAKRIFDLKNVLHALTSALRSGTDLLGVEKACINATTDEKNKQGEVTRKRIKQDEVLTFIKSLSLSEITDPADLETLAEYLVASLTAIPDIESTIDEIHTWLVELSAEVQNTLTPAPIPFSPGSADTSRIEEFVEFDASATSESDETRSEHSLSESSYSPLTRSSSRSSSPFTDSLDLSPRSSGNSPRGSGRSDGIRTLEAPEVEMLTNELILEQLNQRLAKAKQVKIQNRIRDLSDILAGQASGIVKGKQIPVRWGSSFDSYIRKWIKGWDLPVITLPPEITLTQLAMSREEIAYLTTESFFIKRYQFKDTQSDSFAHLVSQFMIDAGTIGIFKDITHTHLALPVGLMIDDKAKTLSVVHPLYRAGSLDRALKEGGILDRTTQRESVLFDNILNILIQVAEAIKHLHDLKLIHRDIKASNIFLRAVSANKWEAALGDCEKLGPAQPLNQDLQYNKSGAEAFKAPELMGDPKAQKNPGPETTAADIYSFAILIWECLNGGATPYAHVKCDSHIVLQVLQKKRLSYPAQEPPFDSLAELMELCWAHEPEDRPTINEVLRKLKAIKATYEKHLAYNFITGETSLPPSPGKTTPRSRRNSIFDTPNTTRRAADVAATVATTHVASASSAPSLPSSPPLSANFLSRPLSVSTDHLSHPTESRRPASPSPLK